MYGDKKTALDRVGKYRKDYLGLVFIVMCILLVICLIK